MMDKPTVGRIVLYRTDGRNGLVYDLPAMVTVTQESHPGDYPDGRHNPLPVPDGAYAVHLTVFTPGGKGVRITSALPFDRDVSREPRDDQEFVGADGLDVSQASGTYVELNVMGVEAKNGEDIPPRSWRWPMGSGGRLAASPPLVAHTDTISQLAYGTVEGHEVRWKDFPPPAELVFNKICRADCECGWSHDPDLPLATKLAVASHLYSASRGKLAKL